jgi:NAD(P) transhydrogenase subunit alpha
MRLAVLKERRAGETRVAATPETVRKLVALGLSVAVEAGAGAGASVADAEYVAAGAEIAADARAALAGAGVVFAVQVPQADALAAVPRGALLVCVTGAKADPAIVGGFAAAGIDVAAMELLPRITRAQSMDVLSSQANLAGYRAVIEGAFAFDRGFPMMMTAAGTVPPARVFVVGAGVAGLQAIATARRLGAIVSATDVRPAAKEEIKSLGASFVGVEDTETAGQTGAYAKEMSQDFRRKQAELMAATVAKNDLVICTALVQGGRAPVLVTQAMVDGMKPGSVIVDIAADGGGNCEATRPGEAYITANGVKILGYRNWPGRISVASSTLYAKNLLTFLTTFWDKEAGAPKLPADDAIVHGVMLTRGGAVVHPDFAAAAAAAPPAPPAPPPVAGAAPPVVAMHRAQAEAVEAPLPPAAEAAPAMVDMHRAQAEAPLAAPEAANDLVAREGGAGGAADPSDAAGAPPDGAATSSGPVAAHRAQTTDSPAPAQDLPANDPPANDLPAHDVPDAPAHRAQPAPPLLPPDLPAGEDAPATVVPEPPVTAGAPQPGETGEPAAANPDIAAHEAAAPAAAPLPGPRAVTAPPADGDPGGNPGGRKKGGARKPNDGKSPTRAGDF